jgi:enoyl-CoA hydratase/carnithine racemase
MDLSRYTSLGISREGPTVVLRFDHGKANEMGCAQLDELEQLAADLASGDMAALISTSSRRSRRGTPIFVAGANVTERGDWSDAQVKTHVRRQRRVLAGLRAAPVFHIAVVGGVALGWGTEYLLTADYRIAAPGAVFGLPETGLGILPGAGGTSELWAQVGVAQALRLGMTGERIDPEEAMRIGLVQELASGLDAGMERAHALAARVARCSPTAVAAFKAGVLAAAGAPPIARSETEARAYEHCVESGEAAIGRAHFKEILGGQRAPWGTKKLWEVR